MDENLRQISAALDVTIFRRGEKFVVSGGNAPRAVELLQDFYDHAEHVISVEDIQLALVEKHAITSPDGAEVNKLGDPEEPEAAPK